MCNNVYLIYYSTVGMSLGISTAFHVVIGDLGPKLLAHILGLQVQ